MQVITLKCHTSKLQGPVQIDACLYSVLVANILVLCSYVSSHNDRDTKVLVYKFSILFSRYVSILSYDKGRMGGVSQMIIVIVQGKIYSWLLKNASLSGGCFRPRFCIVRLYLVVDNLGE